MSLAEVDLGTLSRDETVLAETESERNLRVRLNDQLFEATSMRAGAEREIRECPGVPPWELIAAYAELTAKVALLRDKIERMGFGRRR